MLSLNEQWTRKLYYDVWMLKNKVLDINWLQFYWAVESKPFLYLHDFSKYEFRIKFYYTFCVYMYAG